jgi:hypothetical protein
MRRLRAELRTVIVPCDLDQDLITAQAQCHAGLLVCPVTTPALFSGHRSLAPVVSRPTVPVALRIGTPKFRDVISALLGPQAEGTLGSGRRLSQLLLIGIAPKKSRLPRSTPQLRRIA